MGKHGNIFFGVVFLYAAYVTYDIFSDGYVPVLRDEYWGPKSEEGMLSDTIIRPFRIHVEDAVLKDLKNRLAFELRSDRFTPSLEGAGFQYGFNSNQIKNISEYWLEHYDWRRREKLLNKYPSFKTKIAGIDIHFQHIKSKNSSHYEKSRPILLLHGWPGSIVEYQKIITLLTDPKDSKYNFELIVPSLPGFGFSGKPHRPGMGTLEIAHILLRLMQRLGHQKFYVHGENLGSLIATDMSIIYHDNVMGVHTSTCVSMHPRSYLRLILSSLFPSLFINSDDAERIFPLSKTFSFLMKELGHAHIQSTNSKPDTVGVSLSNSPSGLAAYILEKFSTVTNRKWIEKDDGGLSHYNLDDLLDNVMLYWITNSITSSVRLYSEFFNSHKKNPTEALTSYVPTGCLVTPDNLATQPEYILYDKYYQLVRYTKVSKGGHFAALEVPEIVAEDAIKYFNHLEWSGLSLFERKSFNAEEIFRRNSVL